MGDAVHCQQSGDVAIIRIDDGKANALDIATLGAIRDGLERAEQEASAVLLTGRPGRLSAGFNLAVFQNDGPDAARAMVTAGVELALQIARHPTPVVVGCTGHALAMGAVLLMAADLRVGAEGAFKIGFNEVAIGMATPIFLMEFARERLSKRHLSRATVHAEVYSPESAVDAGFFDRIVPEVDLASTALAEANRLGQLPRGAFVRTRKIMRSEVLEKIEATLADDLAGAFPSGS